MSSQRERAEEKRKEKLKAVEEQVAEGSLTIRQMTPEERELAATLPAHAYAPGGHSTAKRAPADGASEVPTLQPKPLSLKALAGRILGGDS